MYIDRYAIHFGDFPIYFYGIIIMVGVVAAAYVAFRRAARYGQEPEVVWDMVTWAVIGGVIGARYLAHSDAFAFPAGAGDHHPVLPDPSVGCDQPSPGWPGNSRRGHGRGAGGVLLPAAQEN